jgi:hypothetical protein
LGCKNIDFLIEFIHIKHMNQPKKEQELVLAVRSAIEDRAAVLFFLYREMKKVYGAARAEKLARQAIFKFGIFKAGKRGKVSTPDKWAKQHMEGISGKVFKSKIAEAGKKQSELNFHYCPLVEAWKKLGATKKEIALLCDIAMEGDRGRASIERFSVEIPQTIGCGDSYCRLILKTI